MANVPIQYNFAPNVEYPKRLDTYFRFDPPVMLISLVHETYASSVTNEIYQALRAWYAGNWSTVRRLIPFSLRLPESTLCSSSTFTFRLANRPPKSQSPRHRRPLEGFFRIGQWRAFLSFWTPYPPTVASPYIGKQQQATGMETGPLGYGSSYRFFVRASLVTPLQILQMFLSDSVWSYLSSSREAGDPRQTFLLNMAAGEPVAVQENRVWLVAGYNWYSF